MSDNPQYGTTDAFALPFLRVVTLIGRDALAFAQAQFMNDVGLLADGDWQWSGWLDPKGRVQALFALVRLDAETAWLVTALDADALAAALRRYVFRSKVRVEVSDVRAMGRFATPASAKAARSASLGAGLELDLGGAGGPRALVLSTEAVAPARDADVAHWMAFDVAHGWPGLPGVALDAWTPQQLSLQRLSAFSVKKGCYPGQEIVARTHFLGRAKRGLARIRGAGMEAAGRLQDAEGRDAGQIVCVVADEALAVVPLEGDATLSWQGRPVEMLALEDGLAR